MLQHFPIPFDDNALLLNLSPKKLEDILDLLDCVHGVSRANAVAWVSVVRPDRP